MVCESSVVHTPAAGAVASKEAIAPMSLDYIRSYYSVPARRGGRVEYTGGGKPQLGTITGASGVHIKIRLDGNKHANPYHPTWALRYLDAAESATPSRPLSE